MIVSRRKLAYTAGVKTLLKKEWLAAALSCRF